MAKVPFNAALFMALLLLFNGDMLLRSIPRVDGRNIKHRHGHLNAARQQHQIDCSSDDFCGPFASKIDLRCQYSADCQTKCNQFDGVFTCSPEAGYCKCEMER